MLSVLITIAFQSPTLADDLAALTRDVRNVPQVGAPGPVSAISASAIPFLVAEDNGARPLAVAGRLGNGRVIAIGHNGYMNPAVTKQGDIARLYGNMVRWASRRKGEITVGTLRGQTVGLGTALGYREIIVTPRSLKDADVVFMTDAGDEALIRDYILNGGGVIVGQTPWGWKQVHGTRTLLGDFRWNNILSNAGIVFSDGIVERPKVVPSEEAANKINASVAIGNLGSDLNSVGLVATAIRDCPSGTPFAKAVRTAVTGANVKVPSKQTPVGEKDGASRLALVMEDLDRAAGLPGAKVDPSAKFFPGSVPASAKRVSRSVTIDVNDAQWASTGTYAAPGETIEVTLPDTLANMGLGLQVGVHSDTLWDLKQWERHPSIVVHTAIHGSHATLSSPFGGLVVITVPKNLQLPPQKITLDKVIVSPRFVLGKTTAAQWRASLVSDSPWAEIQSKHLILSVPTEAARKVMDPTPLANLWDRVLGLYTDLDGSPLTVRPERIVADQQISAGYMHSGYPIMTWLDDSVPLSLSFERLSKDGTWGHWHELGHNRQRGEWTFDGTGEVTNNVYVLYAMQKINGKPIDARIKENAKEVAAYLSHPDFEKWKDQPFTALTMYAQLIQGFGWDTYKTVIRSYLGNLPQDLPHNDDEKRDQWMVRYSKQVGKNLSPFFAKWGVPVSDSARQQIKDLPSWAG